MTIEMWMGLAFANLISTLSPGQNVALVTSTTLRAGARGGLEVMAGIVVAEIAWALLALAAMAGLVGAGMGEAGWLRPAGGLAMVLIGAASLRGDATPADAPRGGAASAGTALRGALVGFANPILMVFFVAVFPQFVSPGSLSPAVVALCLAAVIVSTVLGTVPYIALASALSRSRLSAWFRRFSGLALMALVGTFIAEGVL